MHLSLLPQIVRYGFLGPIHWAVVEACDITPGGGLVLSTSVGASNTYLRLADKILIELNAKHPPTLLGMHDIFEPKDPPARQEIPVYAASDRIGSPICIVDPKKIAGVVEHRPGRRERRLRRTATAVTDQIGQNVADFLVAK